MRRVRAQAVPAIHAAPYEGGGQAGQGSTRAGQQRRRPCQPLHPCALLRKSATQRTVAAAPGDTNPYTLARRWRRGTAHHLRRRGGRAGGDRSARTGTTAVAGVLENSRPHGKNCRGGGVLENRSSGRSHGGEKERVGRVRTRSAELARVAGNRNREGPIARTPPGRRRARTVAPRLCAPRPRHARVVAPRPPRRRAAHVGGRRLCRSPRGAGSNAAAAATRPHGRGVEKGGGRAAGGGGRRAPPPLAAAVVVAMDGQRAGSTAHVVSAQASQPRRCRERLSRRGGWHPPHHPPDRGWTQHGKASYGNACGRNDHAAADTRLWPIRRVVGIERKGWADGG